MVNISDSGSRGRGFEPHSGRTVVSLSKTYLPPKKVLVIPRKRWLCPNMTEKLFTWTLSIKPNQIILHSISHGNLRKLCYVDLAANRMIYRMFCYVSDCDFLRCFMVRRYQPTAQIQPNNNNDQLVPGQYIPIWACYEKTCLQGFDQVLHKPANSAKEDIEILEIKDLVSRYFIHYIPYSPR